MKLGMLTACLPSWPLERNLHPDPIRREEIAAHLRRAIDAASVLGVGCVGTFIGRDPSVSVTANQRAAENEDPLWGGTEVKILQGLTIAQSTLRPLILPEYR